MKHLEADSTITFEYNTGPIPPPFCHKYKIVVSKNEPDKYKIDLNLNYYDREEITEDEIYDEGFTMDDDYSWKGDLPLVWGQEIEEKINSGNWKKKPSRTTNGSEFTIKIVQDKQSEILQPASIRVWEMFVQEIIQAVFELSKREAPLQISFISGNSTSQKTDFIFSFANRNAVRESPQQGKNSMDWIEGQKLLKYIFAFDYLPENGFEKSPAEKSNYISPGDGLWYKLAPNAHTNEDTIVQIERLIETLKDW
jgi:hypothetical protein